MRAFKFPFLPVLVGLLALGSEGCFREGAVPPGPAPDSSTGASRDERSSGGTKKQAAGKRSQPDKNGSAPVGSPQVSAKDPVVAKPDPPKRECFTMSFKHKELAAHRDGEACLNHDNAFKLPPERLNPKTLCVRVNGTPVKHRLVKGKPGLVMIGSVAGPESVVTVRWCTDKTTCKEDCSVPKDEFMDAIGGMGGDAGAYVQWDPSEKKGPSDDEIRLEKELKAFDGGKREVFAQWIAQRKPQLTCGTESNGGRGIAHRQDGGPKHAH